MGTVSPPRPVPADTVCDGALAPQRAVGECSPDSAQAGLALAAVWRGWSHRLLLGQDVGAAGLAHCWQGSGCVAIPVSLGPLQS